MGLFEWLERTAIADWVGGSLWGYPITLTAHSVGLAIVLGLVFIMNLRFLGVMKGVSVGSMRGLFAFAWFGFALNALSGFGLFALQATWLVTHTPFLYKVAGIVVGVVLMVLVQREFKQAGDSWDSLTDASSKLKVYAIISFIAWSVGMIGGRLIAYL